MMNSPFQRHEVEEYERKRYHGLDQRLVDWRERRILSKIIKRIRENSSLVLDVPCGYGRFSRLFLEKSFSLVSSDLSFYMVKRTKEKIGQADRLFGVTADAKEGLPFKDRIFRILFSMRFFHHVHQSKDRESILEEYYRVISGWVILSFYQKNALHFLQRKLRKKIKGSKTQIKMISRREFQKEVMQTGFTIIKLYPLFWGFHAHHIALLKKN